MCVHTVVSLPVLLMWRENVAVRPTSDTHTYTHTHVHTEWGRSFIKMWEEVLKRRWSCLAVMCVTQISADCRSRNLSAFMNSSRLCSNVCFRNKVVWTYRREMKSFSVPLCLPSLPLCCSSTLLSGQQMSSLCLSSLLHSLKTASICTFLLRSLSCPSDCAAVDLTKTSVALLLSGFTPKSTPTVEAATNTSSLAPDIVFVTLWVC